MDFLKKFDWRPLTILKLAGLLILAIIVIVFFFNLVGQSVNSLRSSADLSQQSAKNAVMMDFDAVSESADMMFGSGGQVALSTRNVATTIMPPRDETIVGNDAENFEVTEYDGSIKTRHLDETCATIDSLKAREDVIFENANKSAIKSNQASCYYRFKVTNDSTEEIVQLIEGLKPEELSKNAYTIKRTVNDFTNEIDVLEKKKTAIEDTLNSAINAYDEITKLATQTQDVASLAKIIDSKIAIIERLTQEKIAINEQLDRLTNAKDNQLDRLDYTYFNIHIYENKYIDWPNLQDSWQTAIKNFVRDINVAIQAITINLLVVIFEIIKYLVYALILLLVIKYGWKFAKYIWQK